jgi:hypothetical protein
LHEREPLKLGLVRRIGDGTSIDIWRSSWIPRAVSLKPLGRKAAAPPVAIHKVSDLLSEDGNGWNEVKLHQYLHDFDANDVKKIVVGGPGTQDYYAWNSPRAEYFQCALPIILGCSRRKFRTGGVESSNSVEAHKGWLSLWNANIHGKIKVHVWRLMKNGLALGAELQRR